MAQNQQNNILRSVAATVEAAADLFSTIIASIIMIPAREYVVVRKRK